MNDCGLRAGHERRISPWTREALEVALPHIVTNYEDPKDLILGRFREIGGSLRVLLQHTNKFGKFVRQRQDAIDNLPLQKLNLLVRRAAVAPVTTVK